MDTTPKRLNLGKIYELSLIGGLKFAADDEPYTISRMLKILDDSDDKLNKVWYVLSDLKLWIYYSGFSIADEYAAREIKEMWRMDNDSLDRAPEDS